MKQSLDGKHEFCNSSPTSEQCRRAGGRAHPCANLGVAARFQRTSGRTDWANPNRKSALATCAHAVGGGESRERSQQKKEKDIDRYIEREDVINMHRLVDLRLSYRVRARPGPGCPAARPLT